MDVPSRTILLLLLCFATQVDAGTRLEAWDTFTHKQTGQLHHTYRILNSKCGLFLGPCGFGTQSTQWEYWIDLVGSKQLFQARDIQVEDHDRKRIPVTSGTIMLHPDGRAATLNLQISKQGRVVEFEGNGKYRIRPH